MSSRFHSAEVKDAAIADYKESGDPYHVVAARHGVSRGALHSWVNPEGVKPRKKKTWEPDELELTGGQWVTVRGVKRWQPFVKETVRAMSDQERRVLWEEWMFTEEEARDMHARYANGCREPRTRRGERVYQRRQKRAQRARREAA